MVGVLWCKTDAYWGFSSSRSMDESDELLIESVLAIVNAVRRKMAKREDIPREVEDSVYRLYWLSISDLGAGADRVQCECPMCGDRMMVPAFVKRFIAGEPRKRAVKTLCGV